MRAIGDMAAVKSADKLWLWQRLGKLAAAEAQEKRYGVER